MFQNFFAGVIEKLIMRFINRLWKKAEEYFDRKEQLKKDEEKGEADAQRIEDAQTIDEHLSAFDNLD